MQKKWLIKTQPDNTKIEELRSNLKVDNIVASLLLQRNLDDREKAIAFFKPSLDQLHDPLLMHDMERAVNRIEKAIDEQEKIMVFGDYDVDGTSSVSMMYLFLKEHLENIIYYIPDRYTEGYGISNIGIDFAEAENCGLIISLDCGIRSIDKVAYAKNKGIDFIVCDHHEPGDEIPDCIVLNPKKKNCTYPFKELSGCGVGFKLLQALTSKRNLPIDGLFDLLDFVAISIGADLVPVIDENRILAHHGIARMNAKLRSSFKAILEIAAKTFPITLTDVVFIIAPRINAAGRIRSGKYAVEMMISADWEEINRLANEINEDNLSRKELDSKITTEALALLAQNAEFSSKRSTVVYSDQWHKGVVGIVASRLIETHFKPTIVLSKNGELYTGSARTVNNFDIHKAIEKCAEHIEQFGGHTHAAGLTIHQDKILSFCEAFEEVVSSDLKEEDYVPFQEMDYHLDFDEIFLLTEDRTKIPRLKIALDNFEPHGPQNMKPLFMASNVFATESKILKEKHLKLTLVQPKKDLKIQAIAFNMADRMDLVASGLPFDIVFTFETNTWREKSTLQLNIKDIRSTI